MVIATWHSTTLIFLNSCILLLAFFFLIGTYVATHTKFLYLQSWFGFYVLTSSKKCHMTSFNCSHIFISSLTTTLWLKSEVFLAFIIYENYKSNNILLYWENSTDHKHRKGKYKTCSILTAVLQRMKKKM